MKTISDDTRTVALRPYLSKTSRCCVAAYGSAACEGSLERTEPDQGGQRQHVDGGATAMPVQDLSVIMSQCTARGAQDGSLFYAGRRAVLFGLRL